MNIYLISNKDLANSLKMCRNSAYSKSLIFLFCIYNQLDTVGLQHRGLENNNFMNPRQNLYIHKKCSVNLRHIYLSWMVSIYVYLRIFSFVWLGLTKVSNAAAGRNLWIEPSKYLCIQGNVQSIMLSRQWALYLQGGDVTFHGFFFYRRKSLWKIYNQKVTFPGTVPHDLHFWNSLLSSLETNVSNLTSWICYRGIKQNLPYFSPTSLSIFHLLYKKVQKSNLATITP